jgi:hypothetical protein
MRVNKRVFQAGLVLALSGYCAGYAEPAIAQPAPPDSASGSGQEGDPPALAGRLSQLSGSVSFHTQGQDQWTAAQLNYPVTSGSAFWTDKQAAATLEFGDDRVVMDEQTEFDVSQLDQTQLVSAEPQGAIFIDLTTLPDGQHMQVNTPRGAVDIATAGQYEVVAGDTSTPTSVTVVSGNAHLTGPGLDLTVAAQQTATVTGQDNFSGQAGPMQTDSFLQAQLDAARPRNSAPVPRVVAQMTGGADLAQYGQWSSTQQYGQVWYPNSVAADWAPYRSGHWAFVEPWGWNWVDDEPWGFAPFHYGRWVQVDGRWGWVAAAPDAPQDVLPVYAPALVSFVDVGADIVAGAGIGFAANFAVGGAVGWVPLGFREPYYPWYHVSERYLQRINRVSVVNVRNITINSYRTVNITRLSNARFATVMPASAMVRAERVSRFARPLPEAALGRARPVFDRVPVAPTAQTPGLSRIAARHYNISLPAHPAGAVRQGPPIRGGGAIVAGRPALRTGTLPANVRAERAGEGAGERAGERGGRDHGVAGLPALRRPGEASGPPAIARNPQAGARDVERHEPAGAGAGREAGPPGHESPAREQASPDDRRAAGGFGRPAAPEADRNGRPAEAARPGPGHVPPADEGQARRADERGARPPASDRHEAPNGGRGEARPATPADTGHAARDHGRPERASEPPREPRPSAEPARPERARPEPARPAEHARPEGAAARPGPEHAAPPHEERRPAPKPAEERPQRPAAAPHPVPAPHPAPERHNLPPRPAAPHPAPPPHPAGKPPEKHPG